MASPQLTSILEYHQRTKHHLDRYAKGPNGLDWADQPDPFRRFEGCERFQLPLPKNVPSPTYYEFQNPALIPSQPFNLNNLGLMMALSFGLSAWKQYGDDRWALRCNPSSGNLHPTEAYLINTAATDLPAGVYHYLSHDHVLEMRGNWRQTPAFSGILIGLSSIHWREAWKYGERAFRYCQHDIGHALGALRYAAAILGWSVELLAECGDETIARLLGLDRHDEFVAEENESPDLLCRIHAGSQISQDESVDRYLAEHSIDNWFGKANRLSRYHHFHWPLIDAAALAAAKPATLENHRHQNHRHPEMIVSPQLTNASPSAFEIIRRRRSAQHFDGQTPIELNHFYRILQATMPENLIPFDLWCWPAKIHLFLFVHRIEGLQPGLYALPRNQASLEILKESTRPEFTWQSTEGAPETLKLYNLLNADCRRAAKTLSCHQDIAADSAFSLAMVAEFGDELAKEPWQYRRRFWESGLVGQALYLEAEAIGMRGTGIGCFFDDAVHEVLGINDTGLQSIYHFTIGKPLEDSRLQTLAPYFHLHNEPR